MARRPRSRTVAAVNACSNRIDYAGRTTRQATRPDAVREYAAQRAGVYAGSGRFGSVRANWGLHRVAKGWVRQLAARAVSTDELLATSR